MTERKPERRGLGRGLSALMADVGADIMQGESSAAPATARPADRFVPIEDIQPNPDQPRKAFDPERLRELADSIREKGVIQPLIVRQMPGVEGRFEIVAGERRWRAAQLARLHQVPVVVRSYTDSEVIEIAIIENVQRAELNPIEEAEGYRQLIERFGHTQEKVAEALGKSRSHIANTLRLLGLPDAVRTQLQAGELSAGHARALITAPDPVALAARVVQGGLSVRQTEAMARQAQPADRPRRAQAPEKDADTRALEQDLSAALGMEVAINDRGGSGQLSIRYADLDQLDRLCQMLSASR
jgi:ParB family transcriptional regulator, chromosome partitioning protein